MLRRLLCLCLLVTCSCSIRSAPRYTNSADSGCVVRELEKRRRAGPSRLARVVDRYLGVPYRWGGTTRAGMDCSAFARAIFRETYGIELPRTTKQMYGVGRAIAQWQQLRAGDLVFFNIGNARAGVSHVGIYLGQGQFAHLSQSQGGTISPLDTPYFRRYYAGARRIVR